MKISHLLLAGLGFLASLGSQASAQTPLKANDLPASQIVTDSSGIPFGTTAGQTGIPGGKPAIAFTDPASPLFVPQTVEGKPIVPQTTSGVVQSTSKLATAPVPLPAGTGGDIETAGSDTAIARGKYLTTASDCVVCHTSSGGQPFAGGLAFKTPFGTMFSSNITPDGQFGIGTWSEDDFINAVKHGKRKDGANLYPSMPYTSYVKLTDDDARAIYTYLKTVPAVAQPTPESQMGFPYNQRWALTFWNLVNFKDEGLLPDPQKSDAYNRGAYVATALGHCSECHTPRDITMGMVASKNLAGTMIDGWQAFNISSSASEGIGSWTQADIVQYLKTGSLQGKATAAGPMAEVISHSTRFMSDDDLNALAVYLKEQPAQGSGQAADRFSQGKSTDSITADVRGFDATSPNGATLFNGNCAACHGTDGSGIGSALYYPSLFHNSATGGSNPANLIQVILNGVQRTDAQGRSIVMPAFRQELSSTEISTLSNYITKNFGNGQETASAKLVDQLRSNTVMVIPGWMLGLAGLVGAIIVIILASWIWHRRRKRRAHFAT